MKVQFSRVAEEQFRLAQAAYRDDSLARARRFADEVRRVVRRIGRYPFVGHRVDEFRRMILRRFPYSILYEVWEDRVYVTELVHQAQEPDYWADDER
ncbi:MAG TPA: type II toxin-antitoxin system RelE/ParE family toxin [Longimicrobium sp.]|nr:type II toxin-antitoxin system RelE/ParE family toxin [Longimicrobium sp.]